MRLPTSEEMDAFVSEYFGIHDNCGEECVYYKEVKKLDKLFTCTPLFNGIMNRATDNSMVIAAVAGPMLGHTLVYGLWLGLQLGYKLSELDGLDRLMKCSDKS
jgi:hypothetical protein